jgi:hypothetical protein
MVSVVAANAPLEDLQHGFDWNWVVEHRERAIAQGLGEDSVAFRGVDLARADDDRRRRAVEAPQELEDARPRLHRARRALHAAALVHGDREIDDGDVHGGATDDIRHLVARLRAKALDAKPIEEDGKLVCEGVLAPTAIGEEQVEPPPSWAEPAPESESKLCSRSRMGSGRRCNGCAKGERGGEGGCDGQTVG